jgi:serine protease
MHPMYKMVAPALLASAMALPVAASANAVRIYMPAMHGSAQHVMLPLGKLPPARRGGTSLTNHGGPVLKNPLVYVVYWGWTSDPNGEQAYLNSFLGGVGGSSWLGTVTQYSSITNPSSQLAGTWSDNTNPLPAHPTDAQVQAEANAAAAHFGGANANAAYFVATPTGHSTSGFGTQWCAYHGYTGSVSYTDFPYMTDAGSSCGESIISSKLDGVSIVGGHEYAESITDPQLNAWWDSANGEEIGDLCAWTNIQVLTFSTGKFATQPLWSNASSSCVQ